LSHLGTAKLAAWLKLIRGTQILDGWGAASVVATACGNRSG